MIAMDPVDTRRPFAAAVIAVGAWTVCGAAGAGAYHLRGGSLN